MKFEELAKELDDTYFRGYHEDRDKALGEFGRKYSSDLVAMEEQDHTIEDVVKAARISPEPSMAKAIRNGMNVQDRLQILEHRFVGEMNRDREEPRPKDA